MQNRHLCLDGDLPFNEVNDWALSEELRTFSANHTIDEVYNTMFLAVAPYVKSKVVEHIETLLNGSVKIVNLVVPKPDIPPDIAQNYKQVIFFP